VPTKERIEKVKKVLSLRQPDLRVVLEEVTNTHNASAVVRTCDAAGILYVDIISQNSEPLPVNEAISTRAEKWIQLNYYSSPAECFTSLRKKGLKIAATHLGEGTIPYTELDYTQPLSIVFGNESEGISEEALNLADYRIKIPLRGMVQSLNLSVSVGIILYEAIRQRKEKGFYKKRGLSVEEFEKYFEEWLDSAPKVSPEAD
jgi:tRNA (guanosine-2'-O-)-methyltransferase